MKPRLEWIVPGEPVPCARPRATAIMARGKPVLGPGGRPITRVFMPTKTTDYEGHVALFTRAALKADPAWQAVALSATVLYRVSIHFIRTGGMADLDNLGKSVLDGIKKANEYRLDPTRLVRGKPAKVFVSGVFLDDRLITQLLLSEHLHPRSEPRAEVLVETASATLEEPLWQRIAMERGWSPPARRETGT
jgi:hypothetical protein